MLSVSVFQEFIMRGKKTVEAIYVHVQVIKNILKEHSIKKMWQGTQYVH